MTLMTSQHSYISWFYLVRLLWVHTPKRHSDQSSRFRRAQQCDQQTDRHTQTARYFVFSSMSCNAAYKNWSSFVAFATFESAWNGHADIFTTQRAYAYCDSDVAKSMVTIRSPFCGYNTTQGVELNGDDLSCYSNTRPTESVSENVIWSLTYQQSVGPI